MGYFQRCFVPLLVLLLLLLFAFAVSRRFPICGRVSMRGLFTVQFLGIPVSWVLNHVSYTNGCPVLCLHGSEHKVLAMFIVLVYGSIPPPPPHPVPCFRALYPLYHVPPGFVCLALCGFVCLGLFVL